MKHTQPTISVIIPTHNRCQSLKRLLDNLGFQTYPSSLIEVVVVADGCSDDTASMLQHYQASYKLLYFEQAGSGAAVARNTGAALASGTLLLFLDDDIEPSAGMIEAHVCAHTKANQVVIGYLPLNMLPKAGFHRIGMCTWWEDKYQSMSKPGYRYSYEDLLSGNFSLPAALFNGLNGFDCSFRCREDYELGARLITCGASFVFSTKAWGYHQDEVTDLNRAFQRKKQEGKADVQFGQRHPTFIPRLHLSHFKAPLTYSSSALLFFAFKAPKADKLIAKYMLHLMDLLEWLRFRRIWQKVHGKLNAYWYLRGVADELHTRTALAEYISEGLKPVSENSEIELDLKEGLLAAEKQLDEKLPTSARLLYGDQVIGYIPSQVGAERLRGAHLRPLLATIFSDSFIQCLVLDGGFSKSSEANNELSMLSVPNKIKI